MMSINPSKYDSEVTWPHFVIGNQNGFDNALHKLNGWANSMDVRARVYLPTLPPPHQKVTYICICSTKIVKVLATNVSGLST